MSYVLLESGYLFAAGKSQEAGPHDLSDEVKKKKKRNTVFLDLVSFFMCRCLLRGESEGVTKEQASLLGERCPTGEVSMGDLTGI